MEWLAGHLITGRYRNIIRLGIKPAPYKYLDLFINQTIPPPNAIAFNKKIVYPTLTQSREQWKNYSDIFLQGLNTSDENILKAEIPFSVPTGGNTVMDALLFVILHETYHIGQMSIIRKSMGYNSMQVVPRR